jgi:hypothetical protein
MISGRLHTAYCIPLSYRARIRTLNEGTKIPSVTVTPPGSLAIRDRSLALSLPRAGEGRRPLVGKFNRFAAQTTRRTYPRQGSRTPFTQHSPPTQPAPST